LRQAIKTSAQVFARTFDPQGPVVEIGSFYMPGYEKLCNLRPDFKRLDYIGCDIREGLGVDQIEDAQQLSFPDSSVGTVLLFEILEHLPYPERAIAEARRVLSADGLLALSVPFTYRLHGFPTDYWRFTASGVHTLLADFPEKIVFALGPRVKPAFIFAVAAKSNSGDFAQRKALFQSSIQDTFQASRLQGYLSALKERGKDLLGLMLGRAEMSVTFFDPAEGGGYHKK
jgi:SAM-dependent methyltransferase